MQEVLNDILTTKGVLGVMLVSHSGSFLFKHFNQQPKQDPSDMPWVTLLKAMHGVNEADMVFESGRYYLRKAEPGLLIIWMSLAASISMMRLNCDVALPNLKEPGNKGGLGRFFKKKK